MLLEAVFAARSAERSIHKHSIRADGLASAQHDTLLALETYAAALEELCWPVPRGIQQDLQMHRSLCGKLRAAAD